MPFAPKPRSPLKPDVCLNAALIGEVGKGKTYLFNLLCGTRRKSRPGKSQTKQYAQHKVFYPHPTEAGKNLEMELSDGPGANSASEAFSHSRVIRLQLEDKPLHGIFIVVAYDVRYDTIPVKFHEVLDMIMEEHRHLCVAIVTKMDTFVPYTQHPDRESIEGAIKDEFDKHGIGPQRVLFSQEDTRKEPLFYSMRAAIAMNAPQAIKYSEAEFVSHFRQQDDVRGTVQHRDLVAAKQDVQGLESDYGKAVMSLVQAQRSGSVTAAESQEFLYASIREHDAEIETKVLEPFYTKHGGDMIDHDDYTCYLELQRLATRSHKAFRDKVKRHLIVDPDDTNDWRNCIRRCPHCQTVWVKVQGCDGGTTCGKMPDAGDAASAFVNYLWERVDGMLQWKKATSTKATNPKAAKKVDGVGCGRAITWKDMPIVPAEEVEKFYNTRDLQAVLEATKGKPQFQKALKEQKRKEDLADARVKIDGATGADVASFLNSEFAALYKDTVPADLKLVEDLKAVLKKFVAAFQREEHAAAPPGDVNAFLLRLYREAGRAEEHGRCLAAAAVDTALALKVGADDVVLAIERRVRAGAAVRTDLEARVLQRKLGSVTRGADPVEPDCKQDADGELYMEFDLQPGDVITVVSISKYMARLWTCTTKASWGSDLFGMLQKTIRKDDGLALKPAVELVRCLNGLLCSVRADPHATQWPAANLTFRGTTMPADALARYVAGTKYRAKMLIATSFAERIATRFMAASLSESAARGESHVPVLFRFHFDPIKRCKHVYYIEDLTAVRNEDEFLLAAYSAFKVRSVTPGNAAATPTVPAIVEVDVLPDNSEEKEDLPLLSWA